jgi:hypothetical protein
LVGKQNIGTHEFSATNKKKQQLATRETDILLSISKKTRPTKMKFEAIRNGRGDHTQQQQKPNRLYENTNILWGKTHIINKSLLFFIVFILNFFIIKNFHDTSPIAKACLRMILPINNWATWAEAFNIKKIPYLAILANILQEFLKSLQNNNNNSSKNWQLSIFEEYFHNSAINNFPKFVLFFPVFLCQRNRNRKPQRQRNVCVGKQFGNE